MDQHPVCPWRAGPLLTVAARKLLHNPQRIAKPYMSEGMTVMDIGCGMGFFAIPMSQMVGKKGKVIAVDLQPKMLDGLIKNAEHAGSENITAHVCGRDSLHIDQWNRTVDFVLVFMMLHEVPDAERLIREIHAVLAPTGKLLFAEPIIHVGHKKFKQSMDMIQRFGFTMIDQPRISLCRAAVLQKNQ